MRGTLENLLIYSTNNVNVSSYICNSDDEHVPLVSKSITAETGPEISETYSKGVINSNLSQTCLVRK